MAVRYVVIAAAFVPLVFGVLGIAAWVTGYLQLASLRASYIPMAPSTAGALVLLSVALAARAAGNGWWVRRASLATVIGVAAIALVKVVDFALGVTAVDLDALLAPAPGTFGAVPLGQMSPVTAATLLLGSIGAMCVVGEPTVRLRDVGGLLGITVVLVGSTVVMGYIYGAPLLYAGNLIPVALPTGISLASTGIALIALAGPLGLPLRPFFAGATRAAAAETMHRELEHRSEFALAAAGAGVWEVDLSTGQTKWSAEVGPMFGLPAEPFETTIDEFRARVHPDDRPFVDARIAQSIQTDVPYRVDMRVPQPDGSIRWIAAKGRVSRTSNGTPTGMLGIAMDVSDRKHLERQVQQAQRMESMGQVAGGIAHDFNNVLTAVLGFSDLALSALDPAEQVAKDVAEIKKAGESGQRLARQLLAFSRQQPLEPTALDLNAIVRSSEGILRQLLGRRVTLDLRLHEPLGKIWADAGQMQQVLVNLAVNARDAMPDGGRFFIETSVADGTGTVVVAGPDALTGPRVILAVSDSGTGMSPETAARIFEPFFTTKAPDKGTGLGLSTVYGIVRQSGGVIDVTSKVGSGTTFCIQMSILHVNDQPSESITS